MAARLCPRCGSRMEKTETCCRSIWRCTNRRCRWREAARKKG